MIKSGVPIKPINVAAFIDWNSQLRQTGLHIGTDPEAAAFLAFRKTTERISRCLSSMGEGRRFRVRMRIYNGWHKGYEPTPNRRAAKNAISRSDFASLSVRENVVFNQNIEFGDRLSHALEGRLYSRLDIHLPNTLRSGNDGGQEEKMVDTALATDILTAAYRSPDEWILVLSEDDDMVPPVYAAEAALLGTDSRVVLMRRRPQMNMLSLDGLLIVG